MLLDHVIPLRYIIIGKMHIYIHIGSDSDTYVWLSILMLMLSPHPPEDVIHVIHALQL